MQQECFSKFIHDRVSHICQHISVTLLRCGQDGGWHLVFWITSVKRILIALKLHCPHSATIWDAAAVCNHLVCCILVTFIIHNLHCYENMGSLTV